MGPHPAVAAARAGVRRALADLRPDALVVVACSGGADSLALAAALAFEAPRLGLRAGGVTVDHGLQEGSAAQAARVVATLTGLGLDPVLSVIAKVASRGPAVCHPDRDVEGPVPRAAAGASGRDRAGGYPGPEAAARAARYAALDAAAEQSGAAVILLGHTMDDQAETVLLGLARGSGARSLAGMAPVAGRYRRPLLGLRRDQTRAGCAAAGLEPWDDPHNLSLEYTRVRVRSQILPLMEELLGPGVTQALARTADQLRADADALDEIAAERAVTLLNPDHLDVGQLTALPAAIRTRVLRSAAIAAGAPSGALTAGHVADLDALVTAWHGQRWTDLPGGIRCQRRYGRLHFTTQA
jgi:tRNA(Ile)-lysidine synthase